MSPPRWLGTGFVVLGLAGFAVAGRADGVRVQLTPATLTVAPGDSFDLTIEVPVAGLPFNAFDAIVGYDPTMLTLRQLSPVSLQEGGLMTSACVNRFHRFRAGADRDTASDVLLCNGVSVTGPGPIYRLRFKAGPTGGVTHVTFLPGLTFYNAGLFVTPVTSSDATIAIGALDAGSGARSAPAVSPNPFRSVCALALPRGAPAVVAVVDAQGRIVRHLSAGPARRAVWDGLDDAGVRLPAGTYWARTGGAAPVRITLLH